MPYTLKHKIKKDVHDSTNDVKFLSKNGTIFSCTKTDGKELTYFKIAKQEEWMSQLHFNLLSDDDK